MDQNPEGKRVEQQCVFGPPAPEYTDCSALPQFNQCISLDSLTVPNVYEMADTGSKMADCDWLGAFNLEPEDGGTPGQQSAGQKIIKRFISFQGKEVESKT